MNYQSHTAAGIAGFIMLCLAWCGMTQAADRTTTLKDMNEYLPVKSEGYRYTSVPYGESLGIARVVELIKEHGSLEVISTRGMHIPNKAENRTAARFDYTFPASCGGVSFSYYKGSDFEALGYMHDDKMILDVLQGGSPYTAPRLWGPYDQVLKDNTPMLTVVSFNGENGTGLMNASFLAGEVADMDKDRQARLGNAYSSAIYTASRCNHQDEDPSLLLVTN